MVLGSDGVFSCLEVRHYEYPPPPRLKLGMIGMMVEMARMSNV